MARLWLMELTDQDQETPIENAATEYLKRKQATSHMNPYAQRKAFAFDRIYPPSCFFIYLAQKAYLFVYAGELGDDMASRTNMTNNFYDLSSTYKERNKHSAASTSPTDVVIVALPTVFANSGFIQAWCRETKRMPSTMYIVEDASSRLSFLLLMRLHRYNRLPPFDWYTTSPGIPIENIYNLDLDESSSWVVCPRIAAFDLDDVQLWTLPYAEVTHELRYLSIDGHACEGHVNHPQRGVQMQLVAKSISTGAHTIAGTFVMANLGYFQFPATSGVYALEIRKGREREIYEIERVGDEGLKSSSVDEGVIWSQSPPLRGERCTRAWCGSRAGTSSVFERVVDVD
ncbi:hypothetical protein PENSPDRAFT_693608 [Peniophora sp. CONT]|nr:hypothetical protein PENSPDRAFT_693608 [Peniophora sp. CONT]